MIYIHEPYRSLSIIKKSKQIEVFEIKKKLNKIDGGIKKITTLFIISFMLLNLFIISPEPLKFTVPASGLRYKMNTNVSFADASFFGECTGDNTGYSIAGAGDVNGDGIDDILILSRRNDEGGGEGYGQAYLIFGRTSGWDKLTNLSKADASFIFENNQTGEGDLLAEGSMAGVGDVNGDGFDDFVLGSSWNNEKGHQAGQVYLIFGKPSGWSMDTDLSNVDASFISEAAYNWFGNSLAGAGDVNGDGFDDILIGAEWNDEGGRLAGQAYLVFGKASGWAMDTDISNADASFNGENAEDWAGSSVAGGVDVNGDGYDDIIINAQVNDEGGTSAGQVYIFFGKPSGWAMDTDLSNADASFIGEYDYDVLGKSVAAPGDVNGDGYGDILIGASGNDDGGFNAGQAYLIFGKSSGWSLDTDISTVDASFIGEYDFDMLGLKVASPGDVNGDGYDDILIGSWGNLTKNPYKGSVFLILGKSSGWSMDSEISNADVSFLGEYDYDYLGSAIAGAGDINGDGYDDILMSAPYNDNGGNSSGQVYLLFAEINIAPQVINSVKVYSDDSCTNEITIAHINDRCFVELTGSDGNSSMVDRAFVNVNCSSSARGIRLKLIETGLNTGKYRGFFKISNKTYGKIQSIKAFLGDTIIISSVQDPTKAASILVSIPVQLRPLRDNTSAIEDEEYLSKYWVYGYNTVTSWIFDTNASWLAWDETKHDIYGTPNNGDVGPFWVRLNITDGLDNYDEHFFIITVNNTLPNITTQDLPIAIEDEEYYVDYNSTDDDQGTITWHLETNASWLGFENTTGRLNGTPSNDEKGSYWVNISVYDGNDGWDWTNYTLTVIDTDDAPMIITENVTITYEDDLYSVDYDAIDIDDPTIFVWYLETNASWLSIEKDTGILSGTPMNSDVGICYVNVTVEDVRGGKNSQNFTLEVINVNDSPKWVTVPVDQQVPEGDLFIFTVNASDVDSGAILSYNISSEPITNITIDQETSQIEWMAGIEAFDKPPYILEVILSVTDSEVTVLTYFNISVIFNPRPTVKLLSPTDESLVSAIGLELQWEGYDEKNEPLIYDVYLSKDKSAVIEFRDFARLAQDTLNIFIIVPDLDIGSVYYWTVIPSDGLNYGECLDGIFSFTINTPPTLSEISQQKATVGIKYQLEVEAIDINPGDKINLIFSLDLAPEGMVVEPSSGIITWTPTKAQVGNHTVSIRVSDGKDLGNISFKIKVIERENENVFSQHITILIITISLIFIVVIISAFVGGTEVGKYKFVSIFFVPLYNRLNPDNVMNNFIRGKIFGFIEARPGEHYNAIKSALKLNNGTLAHHARVLEKERYIYSKRDGLYTRFYPSHKDRPALESLQENLIEIIRTQPGITQREILPLLNQSQQVISYNLTKLMRNNIIEIEQDGREHRYYIKYDEQTSSQYRD